MQEVVASWLGSLQSLAFFQSFLCSTRAENGHEGNDAQYCFDTFGVPLRHPQQSLFGYILLTTPVFEQSFPTIPNVTYLIKFVFPEVVINEISVKIS